MPRTELPDDMFTTTQAAERFNKDESHIRRLCKEHGIGELKYGRIRILRPRDLERLARFFEEFGRNRKKSDAAC